MAEIGELVGQSFQYPIETASNIDDQSSEFSAYQDEVWQMAKKTLLEVKSVDDAYMTQIHQYMCEKQRVMAGAGTNHDGNSVCARVPPGFDKDRDCPWFTNALGQRQRKLLQVTCADLLEEEYFYNITFSHELAFKEMQQQTSRLLAEENEAIKAEFANHVRQALKAGAKTSLVTSGDKEADKKESKEAGKKDSKTSEPTPAWQDREAQAWRAEMHSQARAFADKMQKWIHQHSTFRNTTLLKVAADVNRSLEEMDVISHDELQKHTSPYDCWAIVHGEVFDFTPWIHTHPGGGELITSRCGKDVSNSWNHFHAALGELPGERRMGRWNVEDSVYTTTEAPCVQNAASESANTTQQEAFPDALVATAVRRHRHGGGGGEEGGREEPPGGGSSRPALVRRAAGEGSKK